MRSGTEYNESDERPVLRRQDRPFRGGDSGEVYGEGRRGDLHPLCLTTAEDHFHEGKTTVLLCYGYGPYEGPLRRPKDLGPG